MRRISAGRTWAAATTLLLATSALAACTGDPAADGPSAEEFADRLVEALTADAVTEDGEPLALADIPADAPQAADDYQAVVAGMAGREVVVEAAEVAGGDDARTVALDWTWTLGQGDTEGQEWRYSTQASIELVDGAWQVLWQRSLVEPGLADREVLDLDTLAPERGDILGARGEVLVTERPVERVGIDKTDLAPAAAARSARRLAAIVDIDPASYVQQVRAAGERAFVEAITYRRGETPAGVSAGAVPGLLVVADRLALAPTREFAAPILGRVGPVTAEMVEESPETYAVGDVAGLSGLQSRYDVDLRGSAGLVVQAVRPNGRERALHTVDAVDGEPLELTLDRRMQSTAESLLADLGPASALVALRPSDGAILAAANGPGTDGQNYATYGQAAPGSTFKIVSSLALLRSGLDPDSPVSCPAEEVVDGKAFENYDDYPASALGSIDLRTAVAQSCNTAFVAGAGRLGRGDLADAAGSLGLGIDHDLGFPAYFGQVPPPASDTEAAADMIGQGTVLASPMAMAAVIGSVQDGATVLPRLLTQYDVPDPDTAPTPLRRAEADALRGMLRETVTSGSGAGLADVPGAPVIAKTGTAEFEDDGAIALHAWMVAAQGDLAVAVYVERGESGSRTAGPVVEAFLRAVG